MYELKQKVINWAKEKKLIKPENAYKQALKMFSEIGEVADAICKEDKENLQMEIGDVYVTLIILAKQLDINLSVKIKSAKIFPDYLCDLIENANQILFLIYTNELGVETYIEHALIDLNAIALGNQLNLNNCLQSAYNKISKRIGKTVNGTFIKS